MQNAENFRIAVIGSGPIGKLLACSALSHPRVELVQYEAESPPLRPAFGYGIGPQTLRAAAAANPVLGKRLREQCIISRTWMRWWHGGSEDHLIANVEVPEGRVYGRFGRDELLQLLDDSLPVERQGNIRYGCTVVDVQKVEGGNLLDVTLQDGSKETVNAVWACDGINSVCRKAMAGPDYSPPSYTGFLAFRGKVKADLVAAALGPEFASETHCFIGVKGWHVLTFPIGNGSLTNIAAFAMEPDWKRLGRDHKTREEDVLSYFPGRNTKVDTFLRLLLAETPGGPQRLELKDLGKLQSFVNNNLGIAAFGDAANAMTPHIAGSMSCGFIGAATFLQKWNARLESLGPEAKDTEIEEALRASAEEYDAAHRPLAQKLLDLSAEQGPLWSGGVTDVETLKERPMFLWHSADDIFSAGE
ncbi:putative salicylate hydroxylase [Thozetella sp. PMI_491]|nr:putative salicylate hydroxylase [Thozetella sp. PMI_491]